jgi:hypothetical protein
MVLPFTLGNSLLPAMLARPLPAYVFMGLTAWKGGTCDLPGKPVKNARQL